MKVKDLSQVILEREMVRVYHYDKTARIRSSASKEVYAGSFGDIPEVLRETDVRLIFAYGSKLNIEI